VISAELEVDIGGVMTAVDGHGIWRMPSKRALLSIDNYLL
jgi:hypothetical protein